MDGSTAHSETSAADGDAADTPLTDDEPDIVDADPVPDDAEDVEPEDNSAEEDCDAAAASD